MEKFESERNTPFSVIFGHTLNISHFLNVILGFIPRIHIKVDTRVTPEYDNRRRVCFKPENNPNNLRPQCAPDTTGFLSDVHKRSTRTQKTHTLETAESGVDKVGSSCEKNPNVHKTYMNFLRQRKTALDAPLHAVSSGRSMIEMLGVLAIIGVLSVGGIAGYSKAMMKFKINKTMQQIAEIATNVRTLYAQQKDFNGLNTSLAINMGVVPEELISGTTAINAFNGHVYINSDTYGINRTDKPPYFSIKFIELPPEACIALATADWGSISSSGVLGIMAGYLSAYGDSASDYLVYFDGALIENCTEGYGLGNNYGNGYESYYVCSGHLPMSPTKAAYACKSGGMEKGFGIKFTK